MYINPYKGIFLVDEMSLKITGTSDVGSMKLRRGKKKTLLFVMPKESDHTGIKSIMILHKY